MSESCCDVNITNLILSNLLFNLGDKLYARDNKMAGAVIVMFIIVAFYPPFNNIFVFVWLLTLVILCISNISDFGGCSDKVLKNLIYPFTNESINFVRTEYRIIKFLCGLFVFIIVVGFIINLVQPEEYDDSGDVEHFKNKSIVKKVINIPGKAIEKFIL